MSRCSKLTTGYQCRWCKTFFGQKFQLEIHILSQATAGYPCGPRGSKKPR